MRIRQARESELPALRHVYRDAVLSAAPAAYSAEQTRAWARSADSGSLAEAVQRGTTFVAEADGRIAGFCTCDPDGHVSLLYVRGDAARRGIGFALLTRAIEHARRAGARTFEAEASELSLPLFEKLGFVVVERERSLWDGVEFLRYKVRKNA